MTTSFSITIVEGQSRGLVRIAPADLETMGVTPGAVARLSGNRDTHVRIVPGTVTPGQVAVDAFVLRNSQSAEGQQISLDPVKLRPLDSV
ncbi:MAG: hypothetical protein AAF566_14175, partial [Pseudomonadota bacterium]